jgi:rubrerythrin
MTKTHPELAEEYQGDAARVIAGTHMKLDWRCSVCDHEWRTRGDRRTSGSGCPACANLAIHSDGRNSMTKTHPELAEEYQGDAARVVAGTDKKLDWRCSVCDHEWRARGAERSSSGSGCPACAKTGFDPSRIGYLYIHRYSDEAHNWLKCGITNHPEERIRKLRASADKFNIEIIELDIFKFDDGVIPQNCERELLDMTEIRHDSDYDVDGKNEFFKYEALDTIRDFIEEW